MEEEWEKIVVKGITFKFKNNPKYIDETEELKDTFKIIAVNLERYLENEEYIDRRKKQMERSNNIVFVWLIHPIIPNELENQSIGNIAFYEGNQLIIQIHPVLNFEKRMQRTMFIVTLVHEIFHLFFEDETLVREKSKEFIKSTNYFDNLLIVKNKI